MPDFSVTAIKNANDLFFKKILNNCMSTKFDSFLKIATEIINFFQLSFDNRWIGTLQIDNKSAEMLQKELLSHPLLFLDMMGIEGAEFNEKIEIKSGDLVVSLEILEDREIHMKQRTVGLKVRFLE